MPPIVKIYKKTIITALFLIIILGTSGFVFRGELRNLLDFKKIAEQASLPEEKTIDELQKQDDEPINERENADDVENANSEIADSETVNDSEQEVLGAATPKKPLPAEINLKVPFTAQAPHANWELPYGEACEKRRP